MFLKKYSVVLILLSNIWLKDSFCSQGNQVHIQNYEAVYSVELDQAQPKDISIDTIKGFCKILCKKNKDQWDLKREYHFVIERTQDLPFSQHDLFFSSTENEQGDQYRYLKKTEENGRIADNVKGGSIDLPLNSVAVNAQSSYDKQRQILVEYDDKREILKLPSRTLLPIQTIKKILTSIKAKKVKMTDLIFDGDQDSPEVMEADFTFIKQNFTINPYIDISSSNVKQTQNFADVLKQSEVWKVKVDYYSLPRSSQIEVAYSYEFDITEEGILMGAKLNFFNPDFTIKLVPKSFYILSD